MASLEKLAIRGIRSFSPEDEQTIEFYMPMTIILGQNGSGKTTIIECLKYACTGKLPGGGASSGQSWVHDPKLTNDSEVKACVKLRITGRDGKRLVVVRSMQLQYKGKSKSATFKQVDGVIKTVNPITRKTENMAHKCQDLNAFIPSVTGISAAILDSVVFCHQEDSSWPLADGATLKKKFDDIFESTRYTKALEAIEKCRKAHQEEAKNYKIDLAGLTERREAAKGFHNELQAKKREIEDLQASQQTIDERISSMEKRREEAQRASRELHNLLNEVEKKKLIVKEKQRSAAEKKTSLGTEMKESGEELTARLGSFSSDQKNVEAELGRLRQKEGVLKKQVEQGRVSLTRLTGDKGQLTAKIDQLMAATAERNAEVAELCEKYALTFPRALIGNANKTAELTEGEIQRFTKELGTKRNLLEKELMDFRQKRTEQLDKKRSEIAEWDMKLRALAQSKTTKLQEQKDLLTRVNQVQSDLNREPYLGDSVLEKADIDIERCRKEMENLQKLVQDENFEDQLLKLQREVNVLKEEIDKDSRIMESLQKNLQERAEAENKARDAASHLEELKNLCEQFNDSYEERLNERVDASNDSIQTMLSTVKNIRLVDTEASLRDAREGLLGEQRKLTEIRTNINRDKADLSAVIKELSDKSSHEAKAKAIVHEMKESASFLTAEEVDDPDKLLAMCDERVLDKTQKLGALRSRINDYDHHYNVAIQSGDPRICPCCMRSMTKDEFDTFKRNNRDQVAPLKDRLERSETKVAIITRLRDQYKPFVPLLRPLAGLKARQQSIQQRLKEQEEEESALVESVSKAEARVAELEEQKGQDNEIIYALEKIREKRHALSILESEVESNRQQLAGYSYNETRTHDQVNSDLRRKREEQDDKIRRATSLREERQRLSTELMQATQKLRDQETKKAEKVKSMERWRELRELQKSLKERQAQLQKEIADATTDMLPIDDKLKELQTEFDRLKAELDRQEGQKQNLHLESVHRFSGFDQKQKRVKEAEAENYKGKLKKLEEEAERVSKDISAAEDQIEGLAPQIAAALKELQDKDRIRRQIEDNLAYRRMLEEVEQTNKELSSLQTRVASLPASAQLVANVQNADIQWREAREEKARLEAKVDTLFKLKREQELKLKSETYKDVDKRYKATKIKCDTTDMAVQDLVRYHKALDRALMQYHSMKVEEINKIIRELWTRTYRGNDIEDISIVSGEEAGGTGRATKSYNYRVVMKKGGTMLDMRNRCSAGQRVLASIVIRLALAETFCINCGVMTLDEPTTNLDHENKDGLAQALARLICERGSRQRNFQLIIITHDEDFVHMMKTALSTMPNAPSMPEHYWRISRKSPDSSGAKAYSRIEQVEWGAF